MSDLSLVPIGHVVSPLVQAADAPRQGDEGAPEAWINVLPSYEAAVAPLPVGGSVLVLTWLDRADRTTLFVHPRDERDRPLETVFLTRSPDRPNPIGLHRVRILEVSDGRLRVADLEALDGTPVLDIKPVLGSVADR